MGASVGALHVIQYSVLVNQSNLQVVTQRDGDSVKVTLICFEVDISTL